MNKLLCIIALLFSLLSIQLNAQNHFTQIDNGLYFYKPVNYNLKIVLAEFDDYLAVVEFPANDTVVNAFIDKTKQEFPTKPIKFVFHSHHHQHAATAFDPFLESTHAVLVTSTYNYNKIKAITKDTLKLAERYIQNDSIYRLENPDNILEIYVAKRPDYAVSTDEYNLIYFPRQKVMVSGCLYQKPLDYHEVVNDRKLALKAFVSDYNLDCRLFIPTNSCKASGYEDICTMEMLDSTLRYGVKPDEVADFFQSKNIEYLQSRKDSISAEIKKIPKYYDYYQCARVLIKREAYDKALFILKLLPELYANYSHNVYLYTGDCYKHMGKKADAKTYYQKYISCAVADVEVQWGEEKIKDLKLKQ